MSRKFNSWWHRFQVKRAGKLDGRAGLPRTDSPEPAEFEKQLAYRGQQVISRLEARRARRGAKLVAEQNDAIGHARRVVGQFKAKFEEYDRRKRELHRGVIVHLDAKAYRSLMASIGAGELALNFQAFQVFDKPLALTLIMSLVVALGLPASAHFIGVFVKQWPAPAWRTALYTAISLAIGVLCFVGINIARAQYLLDPGTAATTQDDALEHAFFYINIFVFVTAIMASHFAHDADQNFEDMRQTFFKLDRRCAHARARVTRIVKELEEIQKTHVAEVTLVDDAVRELVFLYRRHNRLHRDDDPVSFRRDPILPRRPNECLGIIGERELEEVFKDWFQVDRSVVEAQIPGPVRVAGTD